MWEQGERPVVQSLDAALGGVEGGHPARQTGRDDPELGRANDRIQLWELLRDLPPRQDAALLLCVGFQLPQREVAETLGVPQTSISRLCVRALRTLRVRASCARTRVAEHAERPPPERRANDADGLVP